jgi:2-dehydropantoate 2-reductase
MPEVVVWGGGAIGGVVGAWMARSGVDVLLVDRDADHVAAIQRDGLLVDGVRDAFRVRVPCVCPDEAPERIDLAFLAVKCLHTPDALSDLAPRLAPEAAIVSLQNGLNERVIAERVGAERTVGCFINFGADWQAPGHVQHGGEHPIFVGELDGHVGERLTHVQGLLGRFCETHVTEDIWGYLWSKLCYASLLFATALVDAPVQEIVSEPGCGPVLFALVREVMQVPQALGVRLQRLVDYWPEEYETGDCGAAMERSAAHFRGQLKVKTGVWRDLAVRRRRTEVDCQVGASVREAAALGLDLPMNRRLIELIHEVEQGRRPMAWQNLRELGRASGS